MNNLIINKEGNFKDEIISSVPVGNNNFIIENNDNIDLRRDEISNIKPMLSGSSNTINIPDGRKVKVRPSFTKKVPTNTFSMIANSKKNRDDDSDNETGDNSYTSNGSYQSDTDIILSNNQNDLNDSDQNDEDSVADDYSSIESNINIKKTKTNDTFRNNNNTYSKNNLDEDEEDDDDNNFSDNGENSTVVSKKQKTYEEIQQEKQKLLFNLERLQKQGFPPSKRYSMASSHEDMQFEYDRLKKQRDVEKSIKFSRKILMAAVSGIEFLNNRFDPFDVRLDGWSENVMENVNDYDEVFEELHDKYSDSVKMAPELKLLAMVAGSGFMFHLTNSLFKSAAPKLGDILKQNPDIMKNISEAAARNMGNTINKEFGEDDFLGNMMKEGIQMKMNPQGPSRGPSTAGPSMAGPSMAGPSMAGPSIAGPQRPPSMDPFSAMMGNRNQPTNNQPKMTGPVGIDELLSELNSGSNNNRMNSNARDTRDARDARDDASVSSAGSVTIKSSAKRKNGRKGIQLDIN
jgi:hypothetical protein